MKEVPLHFGDGRRLFGILTLADGQPQEDSVSRVFVFLNAGLLHRVGPYGLHVRLARELAGAGVNSLRVDLAGLGDSPPRPGLTVPQSVAADFEEIMSVLELNLGSIAVVLVGLCAGADNAISVAASDPRVDGLVLLDPVCDLDEGFKTRALGFKIRTFLKKCLMPAKYLKWARRRLRSLTAQAPEFSEQMNNLDLRNIPSRDQMREAFEKIREREGRVLSIFSRYALQYYNQAGQMGRVMSVEGYNDYCEEIFWPHADHTYPLASHRDHLVEKIKAWAAAI